MKAFRRLQRSELGRSFDGLKTALSKPAVLMLSACIAAVPFAGLMLSTRIPALLLGCPLKISGWAPGLVLSDSPPGPRLGLIKVHSALFGSCGSGR